MNIDDFEKVKIEQLPKVIDVHSMILTDIEQTSEPHTVQYNDGKEHVLSTMVINNYTLVNPVDGMHIVITKTEYKNE